MSDTPDQSSLAIREGYRARAARTAHELAEAVRKGDADTVNRCLKCLRELERHRRQSI